jgi:tyrosyl-tRNA synthetase
VLDHEVTRWVHGDEKTTLAQKASGVLFGQEINGLSDRDLNSIFVDVPSMTMSRDRLDAGIDLLDTLCETGLCKSRGEAKKLIKAGGAYINNCKVSDMNQKLTLESLASESIMVLRTGKKKYYLLKFESTSP